MLILPFANTDANIIAQTLSHTTLISGCCTAHTEIAITFHKTGINLVRGQSCNTSSKHSKTDTVATAS